MEREQHRTDEQLKYNIHFKNGEITAGYKQSVIRNMTTKQLKRLTRRIEDMRREYFKQIENKLKEEGKELEICNEDWDEEMGYPKGLYLMIPDKHFNLVDCVYDRIRFDGKKVQVHQCYWSDGGEDYWEDAQDIPADNLWDIYDAVQWSEEKDEDEDGQFTVYAVMGETLSHIYLDEGIDGLKENIDCGALVKETFNTEEEMKAYMKGVEEAVGWMDAGFIEEEDQKNYTEILESLVGENQ